MNIPFFGKKPSVGEAYCTAPFTSLLVDPNKNVRPCCAYDGSLGNLEQSSLTDILGSPEWNEVKAQVTRGVTPKGCASCYEREKVTGWSVRTSLFNPCDSTNGPWTQGLTQLEINSSNICNLACTHCSSGYSSRWVQLNDKLGKNLIYHHLGPAHEIHGPNPENIVRQIAALDLRHLTVVRFKGGEPMLNHDVPAVLQYLLDCGILQNVSVHFISNGSLVNEKVHDLLQHAASVRIWISIDGTGPLQEYIRRGPSDIARIERFVGTLSSLPRLTFLLSVSVMAYNVFTLDRISQWWNGFRRADPNRFEFLRFGLHVIEPPYLCVSVLQDQTRERLIRKYRGLSDADYGVVIQTLEQPFHGAALHNKFVAYTRDMDTVWSSDVLQVVPELEPEMVLLDLPGFPTQAWRRVRGVALRSVKRILPASHAALIRRTQKRTLQRQPSAPAARSQGDTLKEGLSLSQAGKYRQTLRLYKRYLEAMSEASLSSKWEIRLHRAIVLARMGDWEHSLEEFDSLIRVSPTVTLQAMQGRHATATGGLLGALSQNLGNETGFVQTSSFRLVMEGLSYRALDNQAEAAARIDQALKLDPEFALAQVARTHIGVIA